MTKFRNRHPKKGSPELQMSHHYIIWVSFHTHTRKQNLVRFNFLPIQFFFNFVLSFPFLVVCSLYHLTPCSLFPFSPLSSGQADFSTACLEELRGGAEAALEGEGQDCEGGGGTRRDLKLRLEQLQYKFQVREAN